MSATIIEHNIQLNELCDHLSRLPYFAIDTEFVRERNFYPDLGLIQIYDDTQVFLIDPLNMTDWSAFKALVENPNVVKIIHSCSEDVEVLKVAIDAKPQALYDTQIAESLISGKNAMGLAVLVEKYTQVALEKGHARTNWLKRPLAQEQLNYAADDVLYLIDVYRQQISALEKTQRLNIVFLDVQDIIDKKYKPIVPELAWRDVKSAWQLSRRELAVLSELIAWRLNYAMQRNLAVNFVVHERSILLLCQRRPSSYKSLSNIPDIHPLEIKRHGHRLLKCIEKAKAIDENDCPHKIIRVAELPQYKKMYSRLKSQIQTIADKEQLNIEFIASKRTINQYIGYHFNVTQWSQESLPELAKGWRGDLLKTPLDEIISQYKD